MMTYLDTNIGKIIKSLRRPTLVIFTTDNGICKGNHGLLGKQNLYQESIHVPLVLWSNSLNLSGNCSKLVYLYDIYPTVLYYAGIKTNTGKGAINLATLLNGGTGRKYITFRFKNDVYAVIGGGWKLIWYPKIKKYQLYNLIQDPQEKQSVKKSKVPDIFKRLNEHLSRYRF